MNTGQFFFYWFLFSALVLVFSAIVFGIALRAGHFKDQDRARYLALWAEVPDEETDPKPETRNPKRKESLC